eukprot:5114087-Prymnesium_polylepis.1
MLLLFGTPVAAAVVLLWAILVASPTVIIRPLLGPLANILLVLVVFAYHLLLSPLNLSPVPVLLRLLSAMVTLAFTVRTYKVMSSPVLDASAVGEMVFYIAMWL